MSSRRALTILLASCCLLAAVAAAAQAAAPSPLLTKLPGQYKVGETETYCFRPDGTVRQWGSWGERWGNWTASGSQGVITWTRDDVYKPAKPFRDAFNYYEEQGKARLKFWSLDMPVPPYYGMRSATACEAGPGSGATGPGLVNFGGLAWDEWTVRSKVFGDPTSEEVRKHESPWTVESGVLTYKGTGSQTYQNDLVATQRAFDLSDVTVTFEAGGTFRTEFGTCGPQVLFADPAQMRSEGPTGAAYGVAVQYTWEPGKTDAGFSILGGGTTGPAYAAKFADLGDAEFRPYKLQVKGGKVILTSPQGVYTADAPSAKAGVRLPLVIALRTFDRGKAYRLSVRNLKVVEAVPSTAPPVTTQPPATTPPVTPVPVTGPAFGKPCAPPEEFAGALYRTILGREADPAELRSQADKILSGRSREEVAKEFFLSKEYEDRKRSDEDFVRDAYRTYLGREADTGGLQGFLSILQKAKKDFMNYLDPAGVQRNSRGKVLDSFVDSAEYKGIKAGCK